MATQPTIPLDQHCLAQARVSTLWTDSSAGCVVIEKIRVSQNILLGHFMLPYVMMMTVCVNDQTWAYMLDHTTRGNNLNLIQSLNQKKRSRLRMCVCCRDLDLRLIDWFKHLELILDLD